MKNMMNRIQSAAFAGLRHLHLLAASLIDTVTGRALHLADDASCALAGKEGEGYVDTAVKILMAVVIGALVLAGLYALFGDTVMPTLTRRIQEMFNYAG